jgi:hypothetical protein
VLAAVEEVVVEGVAVEVEEVEEVAIPLREFR